MAARDSISTCPQEMTVDGEVCGLDYIPRISQSKRSHTVARVIDVSRLVGD